VDPDPDPAFQMNPAMDPIWIQAFDDQKFKKKTELLKITFYLSLGLYSGRPIILLTFFCLSFFPHGSGSDCDPGYGSRAQLNLDPIRIHNTFFYYAEEM
jgi:hypothetical protein